MTGPTWDGQPGYVWVCMACGRVTADGGHRELLRDSSCIMHAVQVSVEDWHRSQAFTARDSEGS